MQRVLQRTLTSAPAWLSPEAVTALFGAGEPGRRAYADFVAAGGDAPVYASRPSHQIYLGDPAFIAHAQRQAMRSPPDTEVPRAQDGVAATPASAVVGRAARDAAIVAAYRARGETLKTLGQRFGLHYSQISRILRRPSPATASADGRAVAPRRRHLTSAASRDDP